MKTILICCDWYPKRISWDWCGSGGKKICGDAVSLSQVRKGGKKWTEKNNTFHVHIFFEYLYKWKKKSKSFSLLKSYLRNFIKVLSKSQNSWYGEIWNIFNFYLDARNSLWLSSEKTNNTTVNFCKMSTVNMVLTVRDTEQ